MVFTFFSGMGVVLLSKLASACRLSDPLTFYGIDTGKGCVDSREIRDYHDSVDTALMGGISVNWFINISISRDVCNAGIDCLHKHQIPRCRSFPMSHAVIYRNTLKY